MFSIDLDSQRLSDHVLLLLPINNILQEPKVSQIDRCNFPSQLKDQKSDKSQFLLLGNKLSVNNIV